jgi:hypothetical protein
MYVFLRFSFRFIYIAPMAYKYTYLYKIIYTFYKRMYYIIYVLYYKIDIRVI